MLIDGGLTVNVLNALTCLQRLVLPRGLEPARNGCILIRPAQPRPYGGMNASEQRNLSSAHEKCELNESCTDDAKLESLPFVTGRSWNALNLIFYWILLIPYTPMAALKIS